MSVLDLGCGTGDDVRAISKIVGPSGSVYGVDASAAMIAEARRRGTPANAAFVASAADSLPFESASLDAARAERLFQHLHRPELAARELRRVVRGGGTVFALDPDWDTLIVGGARADVTRSVTRALVERLANPFAGRNALGLFRRAGFRSAVATPLVSSPALAPAYDLFLSSAVDIAVSAGVLSADEAAAWLRSLLEAERRGEFFCAMTNVAVLATA